MDQLRGLLLLIEFILIVSPIIWVIWRKRGRSLDSFQPLIVFPLAFSVFYFFPEVYYFFFKDLWLIVQTKGLGDMTLFWSDVSLVSFYLGYFVATKLKPKFSLPLGYDISPKTLAKICVGMIAIAAISFFWFMSSTGGLVYYVTHQNDTINLTSGKIYLVWGMLLLRTSFLLNFLRVLRQYQTKKLHGINKTLVILVIHGLLAAGILLAIGSRMLMLSFLIEALVLTHYALRYIPLGRLLALALAALAVFVILFGAWRNYGWVRGEKDSSFFSYLTQDVKTNLGDRLFNFYFDSTRNFAFALKYTGDGLPIQYGRTYLSLLVQPIPRAFRPSLTLPYGPQVNGLQCSTPKGGEFCGIDPLLSELYQNFYYFGIPVGLFLFGLMLGWSYRLLVLDWAADNFSYLIYGILVYATFLWLRGAFVGHTSFILMDLVPLLLVLPFFKRDDSKLKAAAGT